MTKEQYEKLKEWIVLLVWDRKPEAKLIEKELDKLMGFE